ncbi:LCP family protein [Kitasatospora sp. NBC_01539]|uniref:LCP family protein n=1 Tax=Kitasatospora sp. NBC_01539 TaxID=2903577 RepID=UPI0038601F71
MTTRSPADPSLPLADLMSAAVPAPGGGPDGGDRPEPAPRRARRRRRRPLLIALALLCVLLVAGAGTAWWTVHGLESNIGHEDGVFDRTALPDAGPRPEADAAAGRAVNILLVGSDSRGPASTGSEADADFESQRGNRTDTMMLLHIPSDRSAIHAVSIPRDSWVPIPGHGEAKINAAFSWGGPRLLVATVEGLTGVRVDHYVAVDFDGFKAMVDTLDGVDVTLKQAAHDPSQNVDFAAGVNHLDGARALQFVRQRHGLARGDFDRVVRQQQLLAAIAGKTLDDGVLSHPLRTRSLLDSMTRTMTVDSGFGLTEMLGLASSLKDVRTSRLDFRTVPTTGTGWKGKQSVVLLDSARSAELFAAIRKDTTWPAPAKGETWKP